MTLTELLSELRQKEIHLYVQGEDLRCKSPPQAVSPHLRAILQARKAELIEYLQQGPSKELPAISAGDRSMEIPLSFSQYRLWVLANIDQHSATYNIPVAIRFRGRLDHDLFKRALNEIVRRHEVLRTSFVTVEGRLVQKVTPDLTMDVAIADLIDLREGERAAEVQRRVQEEAHASFHLATGPLLRASLLVLEAEVHLLLFTMHHIVSDGWSIGVLIREFAALYEAFRAGRRSPLPEPPIQYADYAVWQRAWLQGEVLERQLSYWKEQLAWAPAVLQLPTNRPRPKVQSHRGATYRFTVPPSLTEQLKALSRRAGATLFMVLLAAFQILLFRYSGQRDICVGTPVANRRRVEIEGLIGFFVNTLVLRLDLSGNPSFTELLGRVRDVSLGAQAHQDLPFEKLVEALAPVRNLSHNPLFQVMFVLQNASAEVLELPGLKISPIESDTQAAKFDLTLSLTEREDGLDARIEYSTDLFDKAAIARMAGHYGALLESLVAEPDSRISDLRLLTEPERQQLLVEWNTTEAGYPRAKCLHELFEDQVEKTPAALAVAYGDQTLTYDELNARANQLARHLRELRVGPEALVGLCADRSLETVIGILGILKAGAAYVPIDPSYPKERIAYLLKDSNAQVLVSREPYLPLLPEDRATVVCLDRDRSVIAERPTTNPCSAISSPNCAYVIYTSGSTGKPKGVAVTHGNAVHSTWARFNFYKEPVERFLLLSSFAFDSSIAGIFWTLGQGGCLHLPEESTLRDPEALTAVIDREAVTHMLCLPSLYRLILDRWGNRLGSLRVVIVAGESCPADLVSQHYDALPGASMFNEYGPTEGTVWSSVQRLRPTDAWAVVSIGRPIPNIEIYLLDAHLNPVPVGVAGELYLGGEGLARGYLYCPELTAERFAPNPFSHRQGERLYQTGDLARYNPDGLIEYVGRSDQQVKIRGYRIELGEVEAALSRHQGIAEAVVIAREGTPAAQRLVAYVRAEGAAPAVEELRAYLKDILPEYTVPSAFVFLASLPLTPNGKVDHQRLPAPDVAAQFDPQYVSPRNRTEEILAGIWADVLSVDRVGIHDDFFELGGHSLLLVQLVSRIHASLEIEPSLSDLIERSTVARLAELIANAAHSELDAPVSAIDLEQEAILDPSITPPTSLVAPNRNREAVLLTGSTGFLGAFLLHELLQQTNAKVYCLVRAKSDDEARERLQGCLERYEIWETHLSERILLLRGDLAQPRLGLGTGEFEVLARAVDVIYHNGALVNFVQPYAALKAANVGGTQEVLRLACTHRLKPVHYVSTLSVFGNETPTSPNGFAEDEFSGPDADFGNGYGQSKWVAERMMRHAADCGLPVSIYRPATIGGHSVTGVWNIDDFLCRLIRGCIDIGAAPAEPVDFDIVPVDYVSRAIVYLSKQADAIGQTFHLNSSSLVSSSELVNWIRALGYPMQETPYVEWRARVADVAGESRHHPLHQLLPLFAADMDVENGASDALSRYDCRKTLIALATSGLQCPVPDRALLGTYLSHLQTSGSLERMPC